MNHQTPLTDRFTRPSSIWLAGLLVLASGCGVGDYEQRMQQTQNRVKQFEETSKLLDGPLTMPAPPPKEKGGPAAPQLFFRPPRGIERKASNEKEPRNNILYTYPARGVGSAGVFINLEIAVAEKAKDFEAEVLRSYGPSGHLKQKKLRFDSPGREAVEFRSTDFEEGQASYSVNIWEGSSHNVAIVYTIQRGQRDKAEAALMKSLESFAAGINNINKAREALTDPLRNVPAQSK
jgi:hypothetical protein